MGCNLKIIELRKRLSFDHCRPIGAFVIYTVYFTNLTECNKCLVEIHLESDDLNKMNEHIISDYTNALLKQFTILQLCYGE